MIYCFSLLSVLSALQDIWNVICSIGDLIVGVFRTLLQVIVFVTGMLNGGIGLLEFVFVGSMPPAIGALFLVVLGIGIVNLVLSFK